MKAIHPHMPAEGIVKFDPLGDGISELQRLDHMGDDMSIVRAARVSTAREERTEGVEKLLRYMARHRHGSPFEHVTISFRVKAPLFVVAQWHRHRAGWSYNQQSRRYTSEKIEFYRPDMRAGEWRLQAKSNKQSSQGQASSDAQGACAAWLDLAIMRAEESYKAMLKAGVAREQARMVLPQSLYASMQATCNLRALHHFWTLRSSPEAQQEIRVYSDAMAKIAAALFPMAWAALVEEGGEA